MNEHVGKPIARREDERFLKGRGRYADDVHLEGMLHAALAVSAIARGRVAFLDVAAAKAHPGVVAVMTPAIGRYTVISGSVSA